MKKIYFIVVLLLYFLLPTNVFASMSASMDCPAGASPGQTITCTVKGTSNPELMAGLEASIQYSGNLEFVGIANVAGWNGTSNQSQLLAYRDTGFTGTQSITTITVRVAASATGIATITLNNVYASDSGANGANLPIIAKNISIYSTNNNLASLAVDDVAVSGFNAGTGTYNLGNMNKSTLKISGTLADATASFVAGFGPRTVNLNYGTNIVQLKVTSQSGSVKVYSVQVNRTDNRSGNNNLASLGISGGTIAFNAGTTTYSVTVDSTTTNISAAVADVKASFVAGFGPRTVNLNYGNNVVEVKVIAENQTVKIYTLNIKRSDARNDDNTLKTLEIDKGKIDFDPEIIAYNVSVEYDVTEVKLTAEANNSKSKVEIVGGKDLIVGNNTVTVKVTAENETVKTYTVTVIRLNEGEKLPSTTLNNIEVKGYKVPFNSEKLEYDLKIGSENKLDINITAEDPGTLIKVLGNDNLQDGSKIYIIAVSRDGNIKESVINIKKNEIPLFSILAVLGAVIITSLFWSGMSKKKGNDSYKREARKEKKESNTINETKVEEVKAESSVIKEIIKEEPKEDYKGKFFEEIADEQAEVFDQSSKIVDTNIFEDFLLAEPTVEKGNHSKICPNCKTVNDEKNSTCFFCKTELK
ncbi:MAG: cadherin-like beta sandwich domain-containing protein [Ignavibacteriales bacterium]